MSRCMKLFSRELITDNLQFCNPELRMGEDVIIVLSALCDCRRLVILKDALYYHYFYNPDVYKRQIYNLAKNLTRNLAQTNQNGEHCEEIVVLGNEYNRKDFEVPGVRFVQVKGNATNRIVYTLWELFGVPRAVKREGGDRVLFPSGYRPLFYRGKDVIIVHDLIPFFYDQNFPGTLNRVENAYIMSRLRASIRHADRIVTISHYSQQEMEKICPGCESRTTVIYNGVNPVPCSDVPSLLKPDGPYLLSLIPISMCIRDSPLAASEGGGQYHLPGHPRQPLPGGKQRGHPQQAAAGLPEEGGHSLDAGKRMVQRGRLSLLPDPPSAGGGGHADRAPGGGEIFRP